MHAFITGASAGIGEALARTFAAAGYDLTLVARRKAEVGELEVKTLCLQADLAELEGVSALVDRAVAELGPIDVLVNNAGIQIVASTESVPVADAERLLRLNTLAPFRLVHRVLPDMLARRSGTIVDIVSMAALTAPPGMYHYGASKAALAAASESLRAEVRGRGVHVVTVYPGPVKTSMGTTALTRYEAAPPGWMPWGTADELARRILSAVRNKTPRIIYPRFYATARMFPGLSRWMTDRFSPVAKPL